MSDRREFTRAVRTCSVDGCNRRHYGRGWCKGHYAQWERNGELTRAAIRNGSERQDWLEAYVAHDGDNCLIWPFSKDEDGYPVPVAGEYPCRIVCEKEHGQAPSAKHQAAHSCGTRACVNRKHLRWATPSENQFDKIAQGTLPSALTESDVLDIRRLASAGAVQSRLADQYGVSESTISAVVNRRTWKHIP